MSRVVGFVFCAVVASVVVLQLRSTTTDLLHLILAGFLTWNGCAGALYLFNKSSRTGRFARYSRVPVPIAIYADSVTVNGFDLPFHDEQYNFLNAGLYHRGPARTFFITYTQHNNQHKVACPPDPPLAQRRKRGE
jgi:hypothetical protein